MTQIDQITFYTHIFSPYCHRVHIALEEAKANYTPYTINTNDKPSWYIEKVNPIGKIPALAFGGSKGSPEDPAPDSVILTESLVITEFLAEAFPESQLHPKDLVQRARARQFYSLYEAKGLEPFKGLLFGTTPYTVFLDVLAELQALLPETGFAVGQWSIADVMVAPHLIRMKMLFANEIGKYPLGDGKKALDELNGPRFERLKRYIDDVLERPSLKATWDESIVLKIFQNIPHMKRAA